MWKYEIECEASIERKKYTEVFDVRRVEFVTGVEELSEGLWCFRVAFHSGLTSMFSWTENIQTERERARLINAVWK